MLRAGLERCRQFRYLHTRPPLNRQTLSKNSWTGSSGLSRTFDSWRVASRPAVNGLPFGIHEIDISGAVNRSTGNIEETAREFLNLRAFGKDSDGWLGELPAGRPGNRQPGKFALPYLNVVGLIVNRVVERHFAVAVAMDVAKSYVAGVCNCDRVWEWLIAAHDTIHVQVREGDVARIPNVERQSESALASLLFRLERVDLPVGGMVRELPRCERDARSRVRKFVLRWTCSRCTGPLARRCSASRCRRKCRRQ